MGKLLFTIWAVGRDKKTFVLLDEEDPQLYENLILKASSKLDVNGSSLVLESNGTPIESEILPFLKSEIIILLEKNQKWLPPGVVMTEKSYTSTSSTITMDSSSSIESTNSSTSSGVTTQRKGMDLDESHNKENIDLRCVVDCNSEYMWSTFEIPWKKLSRSSLEELNRGKIEKNSLMALIHILVDEMRSVKKCIPTKAFKMIAKKVIDKYPDVFRDIDEDGVVLGDGTHSLVCKMQDRFNYMNRPHKRGKSMADQNPVLSKRKFISAKAGCPNWAPNVDFSTKDDLERVKTMKEDDEDFYHILQSTYPEQRKFLNNPEPPKMQDIKEQWPNMFSKNAIFWHFNKLTNSDIHLLDSLSGKLDKLVRMTSSDQEFVEKLTLTASSPEEKSILCIAKYFKEDIEAFHLKYQNLSELETTSEMPLTPTIIEIGTENPVFHVFVEGEQVDVNGYNYSEALKVAVALYFILNIKYPKGFATTMELLQRMIFKIHPDSGSKCKKINSVRRRVFNFINNFVKLKN